MPLPYRDRHDAGKHLAEKLISLKGSSDLIVLGLPRGGVPVAAEVAAALEAPLDVFIVRKLGVPGHEEFAMGAIASGGTRVLDETTVRGMRISADGVAAVEASERRELRRRERLYRGTRPLPSLTGKTVVVVDDGLATGASMRAAVMAIRLLGPRRIVAAVPVGSSSVAKGLQDVADAVVCAESPEPFYAVGAWYEDFSPTSDEEVQAALLAAPIAAPAPPPTARLSGLDIIRAAAQPVLGAADDYDPIIELARNARFVLIGEASHGTTEFYRERARITRRLIAELGFNGVAAEADWPDAHRANQWVQDRSDDPDVLAALSDFHRFPRWMWRNEEVREFLVWLREHNDALPPDMRKVGFHGLDLYSMQRSTEAVISYLEKVDPPSAARARARYGCFDHFGDNPQVYGQMAALGAAEPCENEVVGQLVEMQQQRATLAADGPEAADDYFAALQNARLAKNAEAYYRSMFRGRVSSWNLRDQHMAESLEALAAHVGPESKWVVWAHNSHLGDARATGMAAEGEWNLGQLVRERHGDQAVLVGFTTHTGTVTAATNWDAPALQRRVRPSLPESHERQLHLAAAGMSPDYLLVLRDGGAVAEHLITPKLERAIGVIYRPETERFSHYFPSALSQQFDVVIHLDETTALVPLDPDSGWETVEELPETFPFGV